MEITLIAQTVFGRSAMAQASGYIPHKDSVAGADELAEAAGRACYLSWERPNPATATNQGYIDNIKNHKHFSVIEHGSASFYVTGVSRALLLELERHRHTSFSVVSQRYVDHGTESDFVPVLPPLFPPDKEDGRTHFMSERLRQHGFRSQELYDEAVSYLMENQGYTRKQARGAARAFLPEATETRFVFTANHRAFREIIEKRNSSHADEEIRLFAAELLRQLKEVAPAIYSDMEVDG